MGLRVGIAGAGAMGRAHAEAFARHGVRIAAVADVDRGRAEALAAAWGATAHPDLEDLLHAGVDAISVCLPHHLHLPAVLRCAEHGVRPLVEKPHCCSAAEARLIREACEKHRQTPMVGFTHRFLVSTRELEQRVRAGEFGSIELVTDCLVAKSLGSAAPEWYGQRDAAGGGIAMIGTIHSIDRFRHLLNSEVTAVQAMCREPLPGGVEDRAVILLDFACGACGALTAYRSPAPGHQRRHGYQIFGTLATAECTIDEFSTQQLHVVRGGRTEHVDCSGDDGFTAEIGEFLRSIVENRSPRPGLDEGEWALATVLAIYEASRTGQKVRMEDFVRQHFPWLKVNQ